MEVKVKKQRIGYIDIARCFCIIAIVILHAFRPSVTRTIMLSFSVPAFFFLSGCCYHFPVSPQKFFIRKIKTILIPYYAFSLISILIFAVASQFIDKINDIMDCSIINNLLTMLYGNSKPDVMKYYLPLWFLPCLMSVLVIVFLAELLYERFFTSGQKTKLKVFIAYHTAVIALFVVGGILCSSFVRTPLPLHLETSVSMVVWFELGYLFSKSEGTFDKLCLSKSLSIILMLVMLFSCVASGLLNYHYSGTSLHVQKDFYGVYGLYYISSLTGIIGIVLLSKLIKNNRLLEYIGRNTLIILLIILLIHKYPILFFKSFFL